MINVHGQFVVNQLFQITKVQDFIDSNQLEVLKKTPKKRGRRPKNATNNVQTISNPAFCNLSNIVIELFIELSINQCPWTLRQS
jgi:hypothetical protein